MHVCRNQHMVCLVFTQASLILSVLWMAEAAETQPSGPTQWATRSFCPTLSPLHSYQTSMSDAPLLLFVSATKKIVWKQQSFRVLRLCCQPCSWASNLFTAADYTFCCGICSSVWAEANEALCDHCVGCTEPFLSLYVTCHSTNSMIVIFQRVAPTPTKLLDDLVYSAKLIAEQSAPLECTMSRLIVLISSSWWKGANDKAKDSVATIVGSLCNRYATISGVIQCAASPSPV